MTTKSCAQFSNMKYYAIFLIALISSAAALPVNVLEDDPLLTGDEVIFYDDNLDWRVVGGANANSGQFPYIVSLRRTSHFCGGTIVSNVWIVSAAHCTVGASASQITAVAGTTTLGTGGTRFGIATIINHASYNSNTIANDLSVLRTSSSIGFNNLIGSLPISRTVLGANVAVVLSGWGRTTTGGSLPNNLQFLNLVTLTVADCQQRLNPNPVYQTSLCTFTRSGQGACNGDSGGPLVANGVLVGAVSWGIPCAQGRPDVFTRISSYVDWILNNAT